MVNIARYRNLLLTSEVQLDLVKRADLPKEEKAALRQELEDQVTRLRRVVKAMTRAAKESNLSLN